MPEATRPTTEDDMKAGQRSSTPMGPQGNTPIPDPTTLTTDQLRREISALNILITTRLDAMDKAVDILQSMANQQPTPSVLEERTKALRSEIDEKFRGIGNQFSERDKRTDQLSIADKTAIAAALQAQKEAAGATAEANGAALLKMENTFTKLLDASQTNSATLERNLNEKINSLSSRLDRGEGNVSGQTEKSAGMHGNTIILIAFLGMAIAGASFFISLNKGSGTSDLSFSIQRNTEMIGRLMDRPGK